MKHKSALDTKKEYDIERKKIKKVKKKKLSKFDKEFRRFLKTNPAYYCIAKEYKPRLCNKVTQLSLNDRVYSDYIKITKSDVGWCTCVTSGIRRWWSDKNMQNGHFHLRKDYKYRFMDTNCRPQSKEDNVFGNGNYTNYTDFIAKELFNGDHNKAVDMWNDPEFVVVSKTEQIDMVVNVRYPKIQELKKLYGA